MSADILSFIIFLPAIVAIGLMITTRDVNTIRNIAFLTTTVILALVLKLYLEFEPSSGMQFVTNVAWIETYGINYYIGLDGISLTILMMIAILIPTSYLLLWEGKTKGYAFSSNRSYGNFTFIRCCSFLLLLGNYAFTSFSYDWSIWIW